MMSEPVQPHAVETRDRFRGCLVGLVVGECLGAALEGLSPSVIKRLHDQVTEIRGGGFLGLAPGDHAEDSGMMICVAESVAKLGRFDMDDVVSRWLEWRRSGARGIGETSLDAFERMEGGTPWSDAGRKVAHAQAAGNGAMSRVASLALFFVHDRPALIQHAIDAASATHAHREAVGAAVATAVILAELVAGAPVQDSIDVAAANARFRDESLIAGCIRGSSRKELRDLGTSSYCLHTLEAATWCLARTGSFEEALVTVVNLGGDAGTHGAITGGMAGAFHGYSAIPTRWTDVVHAHTHVLGLADSLYRLQYPDG